jgi:RsiW-degrading membrane proteinase PrsW (M82 family)
VNASVGVRALIAVAPVLLFLAALVHGDSYKLIRLRTILGLVAIGALAAGASYLANIYASERFAGGFEAYSRYVSPWIEEGLKAAVLMFLIRTRRVGMPVDAGIAGFAIGTGFAMIENLYYLESRPGIGLGVQVIRGLGTAIMHGGTATVMAMISVTLYERRPNAGLYLLLPGYLAAVGLHSGFNFLLVKPALAAVTTLLALPLVVYVVFQNSEKALREWLDEDLDSKVELLELIDGGAFLDSPAGRMLQAFRDRFRGEDLADMLCLLRLHDELALRAKGVLLLRESGMEDPPLDNETRDKLAELEQLERGLGRTGMLALRPLIVATGKDIWQLRLLKQ